MMKSLSYITVFLLALMPVCYGNVDLRTLLSRIDALEKKDIEQSARIDDLEQEAKVSNNKLHHLSASNNNLLKQLVETSEKLVRQEEITALLQTDLAHQKSEADNSRHKVEILELAVHTTGAKIEKMTKNVANLRKNFKEHLDEIKSTYVKTKSNPVKATEKADVDNVFDQQTTKDDDHLQESAQVSELKTNETDGTGLQTVRKLLKTTARRRTNLGDNPHHSRFVATTSAVAFHAVISPSTIQNLGANDNIKFDSVLLNEGSGYHNQHGLFIAPKPGFYLFSVTIATDHNTRFYANVLKNGARLATIAGDDGSGGYLDQGSVTIVTKLNTGDEVWVVHTSPAGGSIYGDRFTSFTGILIIEYE